MLQEINGAHILSPSEHGTAATFRTQRVGLFASVKIC